MGRSGVNAFGGGLACAGSKGRADAGARGDAVIYPLKYWGGKNCLADSKASELFWEFT